MTRSRSSTTILALALALGLASTAPRPARACGGGFGAGLSIDPSQKIVVMHRAGVETYIFSPHFCGKATEFGLILPIPDKIAGNPVLADPKLFTELETLTAPKIVKEPLCLGSRGGMDAGAGHYGDGGSNGVTVIDRGQVGIFEWVLLKADATKAFTDWLDANKFPYSTATVGHFDYYVAKAWHFVAFRVTAGSAAPPAGSQLCGDLGPISLSFPAAAPVVPTRIAAAGEVQSYWRFGWRVFAIAARQQRQDKGEAMPQLRFSGSITAKDLQSYPELAKIAVEGDRLTKLDLEFYPTQIKSDITLADAETQADFRQTIVEHYYVSCDGGVVTTEKGAPIVDDNGQPIAKPRDGGCAVGGQPAGLTLAGLALALLGLALALRLARPTAVRTERTGRRR